MDRTHPDLDNPLKATGWTFSAGNTCSERTILSILLSGCGRAHEEWGAQAHHNRLQPGRRGGHRNRVNYPEQRELQLGFRR
eukprot:415859-Pyramimonas_sp.AAC.1